MLASLCNLFISERFWNPYQDSEFVCVSPGVARTGLAYPGLIAVKPISFRDRVQTAPSGFAIRLRLTRGGAHSHRLPRAQGGKACQL